MKSNFLQVSIFDDSLLVENFSLSFQARNGIESIVLVKRTVSFNSQSLCHFVCVRV